MQITREKCRLQSTNTLLDTLQSGHRIEPTGQRFNTQDCLLMMVVMIAVSFVLTVIVVTVVMVLTFVVMVVVIVVGGGGDSCGD